MTIPSTQTSPVTPSASQPLAAIATSELGVSGLKQYGGIISEEELRELQGVQGQRRYREMQLDPTVQGCLRAIDLLCRQTPWHVEPGGETPGDEEAAQFLGECQQDMSQTWPDFISECLSMLPYGWSYAETVFKVRAGKSKDARTRSRFNDGRIGIRKLAFRSQDSLDHWEFDEEGGIKGLWQRATPKWELKYIPIEKALLFRTTTAKNNPEGLSLLRGAFSAWWKKRRIENYEAIGIERNLNGIPIVWMPAKMLRSDASAEDQSFAEMARKIARNVRMDEQAGLVFPLAYDEKGNKIFDISLLTVGGRRDVDTDAVVKRYQLDIALSMLADVLLVGHEKVGSYSLASSKTTLFATAIGAMMDSIEDVLNRYLVPRLFELNGWDLETLPTFKHGDIESTDLAEISAYLESLSRAGAEVFPNFDLTNHMLNLGHLPPVSEEDQAERDQRKEEMRSLFDGKSPAGDPGKDDTTDNDGNEVDRAA